MSPEDIQGIYNTIAASPQQAATQATTDLGQAQAARGPSLAAMGASGGNGIGTYTYNRLIDPGVQQMTTQLVAEGKAAALNQAIQNAQNQAYKRYQDAANRYRAAASSGGGSGSSGGNGTLGKVVENNLGEPNKKDAVLPSNSIGVEEGGGTVTAPFDALADGTKTAEQRGFKNVTVIDNNPAVKDLDAGKPPIWQSIINAPTGSISGLGW